MNILVTGGAGFIGTHTLIELYLAGHTAVVVDNLCNSNPVALRRVQEILASAPRSPLPATSCQIPFYPVDIRDRQALEQVFANHHFDACIHFAGLKAVGESVEKPWEYYENNIGGTLTLLDVMRRHHCKNIIFSSSATVYGDPAEIPITERCPKGLCTNPYGWTKSMLEQILTDIQHADNQWRVVLLRYFNPVGAHPSGLIGENPNGIPNNLMPYITQVAIGKRPELGIFGNDYPTPDGTGVRDYIHVCDLAAAHVAALKAFLPPKTCQLPTPNSPLPTAHCQLPTANSQLPTANCQLPTANSPLPTPNPPLPTANCPLPTANCQLPTPNCPLPTKIYNIGTGHGYSVLDMVNAFVRVNGVPVPYSIKPRRAGDIAICYCDPSKAKAELGWQARFGIDDMVRDSWNWQRQNPDGYPSEH